MNPPRLDRAVEALRRGLKGSGVKSAILFGSVARGEATEESDIDLLLVLRPGYREEEALRVIHEVEEDHPARVGALFARPSLSNLDRQFLDSILRSGKALVGRMPKVDVRELDLVPVRLVRLDLRDLPNRKKVQLARELFGYTTRRRHKRKMYARTVRGCLEEWGGRKMGRGAVLIPEERVAEMDRILRAHGAKRAMVPMWIQRP